MYSCILILLARGANVNVVNKAGETPLDCTKPMSDCYTAISLNVHLQALTSSESKLHRTILSKLVLYSFFFLIFSNLKNNVECDFFTLILLNVIMIIKERM